MGEEKGKTGTGLEPNVAGLLCYVLGWITGIVFLILEKEDKYVRFHAIQSIFTFGAVNLSYFIIFWIPFIGWIIGWLIWAFAIVMWIVLMVKAYRGEKYKLPIAGDFAEKQAG